MSAHEDWCSGTHNDAICRPELDDKFDDTPVFCRTCHMPAELCVCLDDDYVDDDDEVSDIDNVPEDEDF